jgi:hypothetical protein
MGPLCLKVGWTIVYRLWVFTGSAGWFYGFKLERMAAGYVLKSKTSRFSCCIYLGMKGKKR